VDLESIYALVVVSYYCDAAMGSKETQQFELYLRYAVISSDPE
jgi:hypothetical protein